MGKIRWIFAFWLTITLINYPNPFNPKGGELVTFECQSNTSLEAILYLYDLSAQIIWQKKFFIPGKITWNGWTDYNQLAGSSIYLCRLVDSTSKTLLAKQKVWVINK